MIASSSSGGSRSRLSAFYFFKQICCINWFTLPTRWSSRQNYRNTIVHHCLEYCALLTSSKDHKLVGHSAFKIFSGELDFQVIYHKLRLSIPKKSAGYPTTYAVCLNNKWSTELVEWPQLGWSSVPLPNGGRMTLNAQYRFSSLAAVASIVQLIE